MGSMTDRKSARQWLLLICFHSGSACRLQLNGHKSTGVDTMRKGGQKGGAVALIGVGRSISRAR